MRGVCLPFPTFANLRLFVLLGTRVDFSADNTPAVMELPRDAPHDDCEDELFMLVMST